MFKKVIYIGLTVSFGFMLAVGLIGYSQSVKADTQSANDLGNATEFLKSITPENQDFAGKLLDYIKSFTSLKKIYGGYVSDIKDIHIVAGAVISKADFLISYNLKHYHQDKIKQDFKIILLTPARFLQYLRSN